LIPPVVDCVTEPQHGVPMEIQGFAVISTSGKHVRNKIALVLPVSREANLKCLEIVGLGPSAVAVPCGNRPKGSLVVSASQQARQELRIEARICNPVDREFLCHQCAIELLWHNR